MSYDTETKLRMMLAVHAMDPRNWAAINSAADEIAALRKRAEEAEAGLRKANDQAEHFERAWYLATDAKDAAESVLRELVALKRLKDDMSPIDHAERADYQRRKPAAWAAAFAIVDRIDAARKEET